MWNSNFGATQFYQNTHYWHIIRGCFCALTSEWNNFDRDSMAHWFSSVQSLSCVWLFETPWTAARHACLSITNSQNYSNSGPSSLPSNHLILCHPLLLLPSIFPSIGVFSNESVLRISWPKYSPISTSASVLLMNVQDWFPLGWTGWISLQS